MIKEREGGGGEATGDNAAGKIVNAGEAGKVGGGDEGEPGRAAVRKNRKNKS